MDPKDKTVQKISSTYFQLASPILLKFIRPGRPRALPSHWDLVIIDLGKLRL